MYARQVIFPKLPFPLLEQYLRPLSPTNYKGVQTKQSK